MKHFAIQPLYTALLLAVLTTLLTGCRRELYVYGDEFYSVVLDVDWRDYDEYSDPDGMTVWLYPLDDPTREPYRTTTANVRSMNLYLPNGRYSGVVVSYSPEEYSNQVFYDMNSLQDARVICAAAPYQPADERTPGQGINDEKDNLVKYTLYGPPAWNPAMHHNTGSEVPTNTNTLSRADSELSTISAQPEPMGADTLDHRSVNSGTEFGDYIPWKQRDTYQSSINVQHLEAIPHTLIWNLRVRVYIKEGFNYLWTTRGSVTGLADGHYLPLHKNTNVACLHALNEWTLERTGENSGWISTTISTFGLRPETILPFADYHPSMAVGKSKYDGSECDIQSFLSDVCDPDQIKLNLAFILRDQSTVVTYHFDVGGAILSYDNQLVLRVELDADFFDDNGIDGPTPIILPEVDGYDGAGFGADVEPWKDEPPADVVM